MRLEKAMEMNIPIGCTQVRRRGSGGTKLTRKRHIKTWFKWRPYILFPKGALSKKMLYVYMAVNWMYYPETNNKSEGK
jgi:hypothetical protein